MKNPILVDESVFDETFASKSFGRKEQTEKILRCLNPARAGKSIKNLYIYGPPGTGKTSVIKWILRENFRNSVYVNCWSKRTSHKIMEEILLQSGSIIHGSESTSELVKKFEKSKKKLIVCLDEADHMEDTDILYDLVRNSCGLILISNRPFLLSGVDDRIKSSLILDEIEFRPYTKEEVLEVLKDRVSYGLRPGSFGDDLLLTIAELSNGDARKGLQTLKIAAKDAESRDLDTITVDEINQASERARKYRLAHILEKLNYHQRTIYDILKKNKAMYSGKLFKEYRMASNQTVVDRTYRSYMQRMEELGLVREQGTRRWKKYEIVS